jgi:dTDP-L-rhamnose 4-epimerase
MKVLVTGGAGFIGSHTVDALLESGHDVRILDNLQPRVHPHGRPSWLPSGVELIVGDVSDRATLAAALAGVHAVFHLAAHQDYNPEFSRFIHVNTESTALLFELAVERRLPLQKIVFASSQAVSGEGRYQCEEHGVVIPGPRPLTQLEQRDWEIRCQHCQRTMRPLLIDELTISPGTTYAISKYAIELLADRLGRRYDIPTVCLRYTYVQGPRNSFYNPYSGIARRFALQLLHGVQPTVYEDGQQRRDYVNVRDVARANVLVLERSEANFEVFNVGGDRAVSVLEFAGLMISAFGSDLEPSIAGNFRLGDTRHTVSDTRKLRTLGWQPVIPVEQNVREYAEWIRTQGATAEYLVQAERLMAAQGVVRRTRTLQGQG